MYFNFQNNKTEREFNQFKEDQDIIFHRKLRICYPSIGNKKKENRNKDVNNQVQLKTVMSPFTVLLQRLNGRTDRESKTYHFKGRESTRNWKCLF